MRQRAARRSGGAHATVTSGNQRIQPCTCGIRRARLRPPTSELPGSAVCAICPAARRGRRGLGRGRRGLRPLLAGYDAISCPNRRRSARTDRAFSCLTGELLCRLRAPALCPRRKSRQKEETPFEIAVRGFLLTQPTWSGIPGILVHVGFLMVRNR